LLTKLDYNQAFNAGRKRRIPGFMICVGANELGMPRLGLAISKKYTPNAVDRNTLKRISREVFRHQQHSLPAIDIIIVSQKGVEQLTRSELHAQLAMFISKLVR
jgi:ribonuclease P protein component